MSDTWAGRIKEMRFRLQLNQRHFAVLIGVTVASVNRWEQGCAIPKGLSELVLKLLAEAIEFHGRVPLLEALRRSGAESVPLVKTLVWLSGNPSIPRLPPKLPPEPPPPSQPEIELSTSPPSSVVRH